MHCTGQNIVVLTFPGHFLLTKLTIESLKIWFPHCKTLTVVADDVTVNQSRYRSDPNRQDIPWSQYIRDCEKFYQCTVIPSSSHVCSSLHYGWVRQQMLKLHLDQIVKFQTWFFTDGDVIFKCAVHKDIVPYTLVDVKGVALSTRDPEPGEITMQQSFYVTKLLGVEHAGFYNLYNRRMCLSNPPFRFMNSQDLLDLRQHVENLHHKNFLDIHRGIELDQRYSVSEWEMLEWFKFSIKQQRPDFQEWFTDHVGRPSIKPRTCKWWCETTWNIDTDWPRSWWEQQGIVCCDRIWNLLPRYQH